MFVTVYTLGSRDPFVCVLTNLILVVSNKLKLMGISLLEFLGVRVLGGAAAPVRSRIEGGLN